MENQQDEDIFLYPEIKEIEDQPAVSNKLKSEQECPNLQSKRQQKRKVREDVWNQTKDKRKQENKLKKKERKKKLKIENKAAQLANKEEQGGLSVAEEEKKQAEKKEELPNFNFKQLIKERKQKYKDLVEKGQGIIIDCSFQDVMSKKELNSLCNQLGYCQSKNKSYAIPSRLIITSFRDQVKEKVTRLGGLSWGIDLLEKHYTEYYPTTDLVYLTGDAEEEIEELDPKKLYIIGGLVDRNRFKKGTYNQAVREGIPTRRLPINKYMKLGSSTILAVNHVFDILLKLINGDDMQKALKDAIPARKIEELFKEEDDEIDEGGEEEEKQIIQQNSEGQIDQNDVIKQGDNPEEKLQEDVLKA